MPSCGGKIRPSEEAARGFGGEGPSFETLSPPNPAVLAREWRNPQHLAGKDLARFGQQKLVGFKDQMIFVAMAVAIYSFGDLPQRIAGLECIKLQLRSFGCGRDIALARGNASRAAARRRGLLGLLRHGGAVREGKFVLFGFDFGFCDIKRVFLCLYLLLSRRSDGGSNLRTER